MDPLLLVSALHLLLDIGRNILAEFLIHEMSRLIELRATLNFDVRGCRKLLNKMINEIGVHIVDK